MRNWTEIFPPHSERKIWSHKPVKAALVTPPGKLYMFSEKLLKCEFLILNISFRKLWVYKIKSRKNTTTS